MKYLAHINAEGQEQMLKEHLENTALLCAGFAEKFEAYDWGFRCGLLHDIGKYSQKFQERLRGRDVKVDHATAGAQLCWGQKGFYPFLSYCIAGHHAGLPDTGGMSDSGSRGTMCGRLKKKVENYQDYQSEITVPEPTAPPFRPVNGENVAFCAGMLIRMLYSCLVDADFLDTEQFMNGERSPRVRGESIEVLEGKLLAHVSKWLENNDVDTVNGRRTEILKHCIERGKGKKGLYRLTVPTGGGKTISSLAFALTHAKEHQMDRVIYVVPYTSIIEQNAKIFSDILGRGNVLEDHCSVDYEADEELRPLHLAAENWDRPVVVTTNVQFFESLFSARSSKCRKLHNIANSVIIFDEAQMLPNDYLRPCIAAMEQLLRYYRSTIVLCTATQPALQGIMAEDVGEKMEELCPRMEEQFRFFRRVTIRDLGRIDEDELVRKLGNEWQALCIVNTRKRAQGIYQRLKTDGVYHLSTAMYPAHRKRVLNEIRGRLERDEKCIVVSTSLVEAGVDLDFQAVYRQLSGIDSIIQAAGRCNREGKRDASKSFTYIFRTDEKEYVPGQRQQIEITESLLEDEKNPEALETIQEYFNMLYHFKGEGLDRKKILESFRKNIFPFAEVSRKFRLIENDTKTVFIVKEEKAEELLKELRNRGATRRLMRDMGQYCVNIYDTDYRKMYAAGLLSPVSEDMKDDFFALQNPDQYAEETGLRLDVDYGEAVLM